MRDNLFVRVLYDDRRRLPWIVAWGVDREWCSCRTRDAAQSIAADLRLVCRCFGCTDRGGNGMTPERLAEVAHELIHRANSVSGREVKALATELIVEIESLQKALKALTCDAGKENT